MLYRQRGCNHEMPLKPIHQFAQHLPSISSFTFNSPKPADMSSAKSSFESSNSVESFNFDGDDAVTLHVGSREHVLLAHASFITRDSEFFRAALKKEWKEGQTRVIKLPEDQPQVVSHYLNYTYTKKLPVDMIPSDILSGDYEQPDEYFAMLAKLLQNCMSWASA